MLTCATPQVTSTRALNTAPNATAALRPLQVLSPIHVLCLVKATRQKSAEARMGCLYITLRLTFLDIRSTLTQVCLTAWW